VFLKVSEAKESFLEKLKREREEAAQKQTTKPATTVEVVPKAASPVKQPALPTLKSKVESSESSSSSESEEEEEPVKKAAVKTPAKLVPMEKIDDGVVRKYNKDSYIEKGMLKIVTITGQVKEIIDKTRKPKELDAKGRAADDKRKDALNKIKEAADQQKLAIKSALSNVNGAKRNKILFDDDGVQAKYAPRESRAQPEYQNDDRFAMGKNFQDKGNDEPRKKKKKMVEADMEAQKKPGTPVMLRFDPTNREHVEKFVLPKGDKAGKRDEFKVDDNRFYNVSDNLTQALRKDEGFSLLGMLGRSEDHPAETSGYQDEYREIPIQKKSGAGMKKFKYDSSESEDEHEAGAKGKPKATAAKAEKPKKPKKSKTKQQTKFFIFSNDERLQEGMKFFTRDFDPEEERQLLGHLRKEVRAGLRKKRFKVMAKNSKTSFHARPRRMGKGKPLDRKALLK
jgi:nucleolar protein 8